MKRCSREKWLVKSQQDKADAVVTSPSALSANVRKGADVLSEVLAEDSRETRIGLSAAARKAAETFAKMPGSKVIKHAQAHRHMTASASQLHSWDEKGNPIPFTLNVLNINSLQFRSVTDARKRANARLDATAANAVQSVAISRCNHGAVLLAADARNDCDCCAEWFKLVMRVNLVRFRRCVAGKFLPDFLRNTSVRHRTVE